MTALERVLTVAVKETTSSRPRRSKAKSSAAVAASVAYP